MRENEPVLLVLSVCDGKIILEKGEILYEKCHLSAQFVWSTQERGRWRLQSNEPLRERQRRQR